MSFSNLRRTTYIDHYVHHKKLETTLSKVVFGVSFLAPFLFVLFYFDMAKWTWFGLSVYSLLWLSYSIIKKDFGLIILSTMWLLVFSLLFI